MSSIPEYSVRREESSPAVLAWLDQVTAIRSSVLSNRIVTIDDPRVQQIIESGRYFNGDPMAIIVGLLGDDDFTLESWVFKSMSDLPPMPDIRPYWADKQVVHVGSWPEIEVVFSNEISIDAIGFKVDVVRQDTLFAESSADPDYVWSQGEWSVDEHPSVSLRSNQTSAHFEFDDTTTLYLISEAISDLAARIDRAEAQAMKTEPEASGLDGVGGGN